jgi:hypothetical protein
MGPLFFDLVFLPHSSFYPSWAPLGSLWSPLLASVGLSYRAFSQASIGRFFGLFLGPCVAPFRSPRGFHWGPHYLIPSSLPHSSFPFPGTPLAPFGAPFQTHLGPALGIFHELPEDTFLGRLPSPWAILGPPFFDYIFFLPSFAKTLTTPSSALLNAFLSPP